MATLSRFPSLFDLPQDRSHKNLTSLSTINEIRPQTSSGLQPGPRRRRRTDTVDSIRNSIFGQRKRSDGDLSGRTLSQHHTQAGLRPITPVVTTNSEEEFYRHRKKSSISPPFNFQHISHAARGSLPPLDTVDELELQQHFQCASQWAAAPGELQDIRAEKLQERIRLENTGPDELQPQYELDQGGLPDTPDETTFDEAQDTRFDPTACLPSLQPVNDGVPRPRRHASLFSLDQAAEWLSARTESQTEACQSSPTAFVFHAMDNSPTYNSSTSGDTIVQDAVSPRPATLSVVLDIPAAALDDDARLDSLSPVDQHSNKSLRSAAPSHLSIASFTSSVTSFPSSSSRYTAKSLAFSSIGDSPGDYRLSDLSWEEEIDFIYEQEAEATCDFDWRRYARSSGCTFAMSSQTCLPDQFTPQSTVAISSTRQGFTPSLLAASPKPSEHSRGSSVGHRGFLLARNASAENLGKLLNPKLSPVFVSSVFQPSDLSPVLSEGTDDLDISPQYKEPIRPVSMGGISSSPLSGAKPTRPTKPWHRKSKSYSSCDSPADANTAAKKRSRWSIASVACIPELIYNSRKAGSANHQRSGSRALKALPSLPNAYGAIQRTEQKILPPLPGCSPIQEDEPSTSEPTSPRKVPFPDDDATDADEEADHVPVMRRPQSPGERAALQAAGSAVRRSRPRRSFTPNRYSRQPTSPLSPPPVGWI